MGYASARVQPVTSIREILFTSDLSAESDRAFAHAKLWAERFGARLTLYHVNRELPVHVMPRDLARRNVDREEEICADIERAATDHLSPRAADLAVPHRILVERRGSPHRAILDLIRSAQPDLTVMATHGREGLAHLFLGSVTEQVIQHAQRPVLCVREAEHGEALPYRRILVPTDLSLASRRAFPLAALAAASFGAEVLGLYVAPAPSVAAVGAKPQELTAPVPTEAAVWKFLQGDFAGLDLTALLYVGSAWDRIVHVARAEEADLIVMSTRGHDSLGDRILGSHTERVVRHAPCPVLVA